MCLQSNDFQNMCYKSKTSENAAEHHYTQPNWNAFARYKMLSQKKREKPDILILREDMSL